MSKDVGKPTVFVMQSFDGGTFDKRYAESVRPGVLKGGAEPRRADDILGVQPIIHKIEDAIRSADICLAEVSEDNPNVWLELGYALALDKPTVILCDRSFRAKLPFDVQHRPVIFYSTDSKSGYEELEARVAAEVKNLCRVVASQASNPTGFEGGVADVGDLKGYEIATLCILLAAWSISPSGLSNWEIDRKLDRSMFSEAQIALGLNRLIRLGYVEQGTEEDRDGGVYFNYRVTPAGILWLHANESAISPIEGGGSKRSSSSVGAGFDDDSIPF